MEEQTENFKCDEKDVAIELKVLLEEFYIADIADKENSITLKFHNGQTFKIDIKEVS